MSRRRLHQLTRWAVMGVAAAGLLRAVRQPRRPPETGYLPLLPDDGPDMGAMPVARPVLRDRLIMTMGILALALVVVILPLVAGPPFGRSGGPLMSGLTSSLGFSLLTEARVARKHGRRASGTLLTVRTWTGAHTIDLSALTRVRCWISHGRTRSTAYFALTDTAGVHVLFNGHIDRELIARAVRQLRSGPAAPQVQVTARALKELGIEPAPKPSRLGAVAVPLIVLILFAGSFLVSLGIAYR